MYGWKIFCYRWMKHGLFVWMLGTAVCVILMVMTWRKTPNLLHQETGTPLNDPKYEMASTHTCLLPKLEMYPSEKFRTFFKDFPKPKCPAEENWVSIKNGVFKFSRAATAKYGSITCQYVPILRGNDDFSFHDGVKVKVTDGSTVKDAVMRVTCTSGRATYENIHIAVPFDEKVHKRAAETSLPEGALDLNVLMYGFDSVSRLTWMRKLPKTYAYLKEVLGAVVLEGYNIFGDGTIAALLPLLTGKTEEELPEARQGHPAAKNLDEHPWIWKDFQRSGYVSQWVEDGASSGTFTYRMLGFKDPPTDQYVRHFYLALESYGNDKYCLKSEYKFNVILNYLTELFAVYKDSRKFSFGFNCELSHDDNRPLSFADDDMKAWLSDLKERGYLNKTLLIIMSDHGARFTNLRETEQGKQEEHNPFFSLTLPGWFKKKYKKAYNNLVQNSKRLTTPFDIHATFRHLLGKRDTSIKPERAYSLFSEIPETRTCEHAQVAAHWCNCLNWNPVPVDSKAVHDAANAFVDFLNEMTKNVRDKCHVLQLDKIISAVVYAPNSDLLKFKGSSDADGRVADLTGNTKNAAKIYQLTIHATPGGGHFETTIKHDLEKQLFLVNKDEISRTNKYGDDPYCVMAELPYLRQFCYCKK